MNTPLAEYSLDELFVERDISERFMRDLELEIRRKRRAAGEPATIPERISAHLSDGITRSLKELTRLLDDVDDRRVSAALTRMQRKDQVARVERGRYTLKHIIQTHHPVA